MFEGHRLILGESCEQVARALVIYLNKAQPNLADGSGRRGVAPESTLPEICEFLQDVDDISVEWYSSDDGGGIESPGQLTDWANEYGRALYDAHAPLVQTAVVQDPVL